ncbi:exonuclease domain-containing protein [Helicobacter suis]|uniref:exonuclease domain-containing protein n=1 Tax=Helicobacter suis TaxID=104628 RepID=UPI00159A6A2C|nr:exonuclease domain-containing protein [Helicobacter suis]BCD51594.1 hypothetical protein NHP194022_12650 [Helicobacter suis]
MGDHPLKPCFSEPYYQSLYCFIDIETTGSKPENSSMIEIAALLYEPPKNPMHKGQIIRSFSSLIHCLEVPPKITELTGLSTDDLKEAPPLEAVLQDFKLFIQDHIFVAHNADFDFHFISACCVQVLDSALSNAKLCTLNLARKCIPSPRHGLQFLNTFLGLDIPISHRAYADALASLRVFEHCLRVLPQEIYTAQDLLDYGT